MNLAQHLLAAPWLLLAPPDQAPEPTSVQTYWLLGVVLGLLVIAYAIGRLLKRYPESSVNPALVERFNHRIRVWWMMCAILVAGFLLGRIATVILFGMVSFWALREFITMTPTRRGDHRALFWVFFVFTPAHYVLIGCDSPERDFYGLFSIAIPVYGLLYIPARIALSNDPKRFLERSAKIQAGLFICVYCLSYAPALLSLDLTRSDGTPWNYREPLSFLDSQPTEFDFGQETFEAIGDEEQRTDISRSHLPNAGLLFYFILIVQLQEVLHNLGNYLLGRRVIAPAINASRTWEGLGASITCSTLIGALLWWATPFRFWEAACMAMIVSIMGFAGGMVMSAIKRDRGVDDYGTLVQGHPGVLDRIDSICFAAPVFYHLTRYFFSSAG